MGQSQVRGTWGGPCTDGVADSIDHDSLHLQSPSPLQPLLFTCNLLGPNPTMLELVVEVVYCQVSPRQDPDNFSCPHLHRAEMIWLPKGVMTLNLLR